MSKNYRTLENQRVSYLAKEAYLQSCYTQVSPMDFYEDLFPAECLQDRDVKGDGKCCAIFRFVPDISTYKKLKARITGEVYDDFNSDYTSLYSALKDSVNKDLVTPDTVKGFGLLPEKDVKKLKERLDDLDQKFHADAYHIPGQAYKLTYTTKDGEVKEAKFDQRVMSDFVDLHEAIGKATAYMAPITYFGAKANSENARWLHAITIDLDGVGISQLKTLIAYIQNDLIPTPTYLVNSGHGIHLYYFLEEPIFLQKESQQIITNLKNALAEIIWVKRTSVISDHRDFQGCTQMYRVVGSMSKLGTGYPATAYLTGKPVTVEYLNDYLLKENRVSTEELNKPVQKSGHDLKYWKKNNPDWYRRVVKKRFTDKDRQLANEYVEYDADGNQLKRNKKTKRGRFPWLYESFKPRMLQSARVGNRYFCMCVLFADACQCGIPYKDVQDYARSLLDEFNVGITNEKDLFTLQDIEHASAKYDSKYIKFMRLDNIEKMTGITFPRNKRNGNEQTVHCAMMRATKGVKVNMGLAKDTRFGAEGGNDPTLGGRPTAEKTIRAYLQDHPDAKKVEVIRETGLSKPTVYKWYDKIKAEGK